MKDSLKRLGVAVGAVIALWAAWLIGIDLVDAHNYPSASGSLHVESSGDYEAAIVQYEERTRAPITCVARVYGYDDKYLYSSGACGVYSNLHTIRAKQESGYALSGRYEYATHPLRIVNHEYVGDGDMSPTAKELFPQAIYKKLYAPAGAEGIFEQLDQKAKQPLAAS